MRRAGHDPLHRVPGLHRRAAAAAAPGARARARVRLPGAAALRWTAARRGSPQHRGAPSAHPRPHRTVVTGDITAARPRPRADGGAGAAGGPDRRLPPGRRLRPRGGPRPRPARERRGHAQRPALPGRARRGCERLHYVSTAYVSGTRHRRRSARPTSTSGQSLQEPLRGDEVPGRGGGGAQRPARHHLPSGHRGGGLAHRGDGRSSTVPTSRSAAMERVPSPGLFLRSGRGRNPANLVPVDFVIEAMARLAVAPGRAGEDVPPDRSRAAVRASRSRGCSRASWGSASPTCRSPRRVAKAAVRARARCSSYFGMPVQTLDYFDHPCRYDTTQATARPARALGVALPAASRPTWGGWSRSTARTATASAARRWSRRRPGIGVGPPSSSSASSSSSSSSPSSSRAGAAVACHTSRARCRPVTKADALESFRRMR